MVEKRKIKQLLRSLIWTFFGWSGENHTAFSLLMNFIYTVLWGDKLGHLEYPNNLSCKIASSRSIKKCSWLTSFAYLYLFSTSLTLYGLRAAFNYRTAFHLSTTTTPKVNKCYLFGWYKVIRIHKKQEFWSWRPWMMAREWEHRRSGKQLEIKLLMALNKHKSSDRNELLPKVLREFALWTLLIRVTCIITENEGDVENLDIREVAYFQKEKINVIWKMQEQSWCSFLAKC